jgi:hypothetical protein
MSLGYSRINALGFVITDNMEMSSSFSRSLITVTAGGACLYKTIG